MIKRSGSRSTPRHGSPAGPPAVDSTGGRQALGAGSARRATHLVDRAVEWARRIDRGESQADIMRSYPARRRPSRGYVSIVARLGHALKDLPPLELALYRSDRVTLQLAQRVVRSDADTIAIRYRLREAITSLPRPTGRPRGQRRGRGSTSPTSDLPAWGTDGAWAERDPAGYVEAYAEYLERLHRQVTRQVRAAVARRSAPPLPIAGQSLASLSASVAAYRQAQLAAPGSGIAARALSVADRRALDLLQRLGQALADVTRPQVEDD